MSSTYQVITCKKCNKTFVLHIARKLCDECKKIKLTKPAFVVDCKGCGKSFATLKTNKKYCSKFCKKDYEHIKYKEKTYGNISN